MAAAKEPTYCPTQLTGRVSKWQSQGESRGARPVPSLGSQVVARILVSLPWYSCVVSQRWRHLRGRSVCCQMEPLRKYSDNFLSAVPTCPFGDHQDFIESCSVPSSWANSLLENCLQSRAVLVWDTLNEWEGKPTSFPRETPLEPGWKPSFGYPLVPRITSISLAWEGRVQVTQRGQRLCSQKCKGVLIGFNIFVPMVWDPDSAGSPPCTLPAALL